MKRILLLGASGSIGRQTIDVIKANSNELSLVGASVGSNEEYLEELLKNYELRYAYTIKRNEKLEKENPYTKFFYGPKGIEEMVKEEEYDLLVNALVGFVGFMPTLNAIRSHKDIALANKETLVGAGDIIMNAAIKNEVSIYPIDSEHSAIAQCLKGNEHGDIRRLIITGSGGAFRDLSREELKDVTLEKALRHPNWNMGAKITIDSATMMNKGFEIMEAHYLFNIPYDKIDVIIQDESYIHSMIEFKDGSILAQMGAPDMHLPIKYALLDQKHIEDNNNSYLDIDELSQLHFRKMNYSRYPFVKLAKEIGKFGGNFGAILIGANDEAVDLFMNKRIEFVDIEKLVFGTLENAHFIKNPEPHEILESHKWAKEYVDTLWANAKY